MDLGTIYDLNCNCFSKKVWFIWQRDTYSIATKEKLQRRVGFLLLSRRYITIKDSYVSIVTIVILSINFSIIFFPQLIYFFIITISMIININTMLCLSCFIFDIYSPAATFFFNLVFFSLLCSFVVVVVSNYCKYRR